MNPNTKRSILRWIHILFGLTLIGYIYGPPEVVQPYAPFFRYFYFPIIVLTGFLMWKGEALRRLISKKSD
jgi:thiosulfate reductase cytochrome b subunit